MRKQLLILGILVAVFVVADSMPPQYSSVGQNNTFPRLNDSIMFFVNGSDNVSLDSFVFSWNASGAFVNDTWRKFNFTGGEHSVDQDKEDGNATSGNVTDTGQAFDEDWSTRQRADEPPIDETRSGWVYENFTIPANIYGANWTAKAGCIGQSSTRESEVYYLNSSGGWELLGEFGDNEAAGNLDNKTLQLPAESLNSTLQMRTEVWRFTGLSGGSCSSKDYYEGKVTWLWLNSTNQTYEKELNYSRNISFVSWRVFFNDTSGNENMTSLQSFSINKYKPNVTVVIDNKPLNFTDHLNISGTYEDWDNDTLIQNETRWYNGTTYISAYDNLTSLNPSNTTEGQTWTASLRSWDGFNWSDWDNDTVVIADFIAGNITSATISSDSVTTSDTITFSTDFVDSVSTPDSDACTIQLFKSDLLPSRSNYTTDTKATDTYSRELSASLFGTGTLTWEKVWCDDGSGNIAENQSVDIDLTISNPPSGGGGGDTIISTSDCKIALINPQAGKSIESYAPIGTEIENMFTIKNTGNKSGLYSFSIEDNTLLEESCSFGSAEEPIGADISFTNTLICSVPSEFEEGRIKVEACGVEGNYVLRVGDNPLQRFASFLNAGEIEIFGQRIPFVIFWIGVIFIIPIGLGGIIALRRMLG